MAKVWGASIVTKIEIVKRNYIKSSAAALSYDEIESPVTQTCLRTAIFNAV